jgi:hypothetical protein
MRRVLLDMLVATRPARTLVCGFLGRQGNLWRALSVGRGRADAGGIVRVAAAHGHRPCAADPPIDREGEIVGVMTPNAAPTLALILALSASQARAGDAELYGGNRRSAGRLHRRRHQEYRRLTRLRRESAARTAARSIDRGTASITSRTSRRTSACAIKLSVFVLQYMPGDHGRAAARRSGHRAVHLRVGRQAQGRCAHARLDPVERRADPCARGLHAARQIHDRVAGVPFVRPDLRRDHAPGLGLQGVSVSDAAALPRDSRTGLRPQLHRAVRHLDIPRQLRQARASVRLRPLALCGRGR